MDDDGDMINCVTNHVMIKNARLLGMLYKQKNGSNEDDSLSPDHLPRQSQRWFPGMYTFQVGWIPQEMFNKRLYYNGCWWLSTLCCGIAPLCSWLSILYSNGSIRFTRFNCLFLSAKVYGWLVGHWLAASLRLVAFG